MNRLAKGFRVFGGFLMFLNLVAFFLPVAISTKQNYPTLQWTELDYVKGLASQMFPYEEDAVTGMTGMQMFQVVGLMLLPVLLAVGCTIWCLISQEKAIWKVVLGVLITILYAVMVIKLPDLFPEHSGERRYDREIACILHLVFSGAGLLMVVISLLLSTERQREEISEIPQVKEIKQEQIEAKYSILVGEPQEQVQGSPAPQMQPEQHPQVQIQEEPQMPPYQPGNPRGVLVGLKGMYAGAEIPLTDGEVLALGRQADNHLIFDNQGKVSRKHCRIRWDGTAKKFYIIDTSSNGTFISGMDECLAHNLELPLDPGTVLEIGDETNTFRLE